MDVVTMITIPILTVEHPSWNLINKAYQYPTLSWVADVQNVRTLFVLPPSFHGKARPNVGENTHTYQVPDIFGGATPQAQLITSEGAASGLINNGLVQTSIVSSTNGSRLPVYEHKTRSGTRVHDHPYTYFLATAVSLLDVNTDSTTQEVKCMSIRTIQARLQDDLVIVERQFIKPRHFIPMQSEWQPQITAAAELVRCHETYCKGHYHL